jgi:hypothetical protein
MTPEVIEDMIAEPMARAEKVACRLHAIRIISLPQRIGAQPWRVASRVY